MKTLRQFIGAKVDSVELINAEDFVMVLVLPDGTERVLAVYHPGCERLCVRVDGMYVPSEDL